MASYKLSEYAKDDLTRLYFYGLEIFGEAQADRYYAGLFAQFERIAEQPLTYPSVDAIRPHYRRCVSGSDSIYFRIGSEGVEIMAIIGKQDADAWL